MRKKRTTQRWDCGGQDPWLDTFGVGGGRKELSRLMTLYSRESRKGDAQEEKGKTEAPRWVNPRSRMVNIAKIQDILQKTPWERRADEVEMVQREVGKLEVFRPLRVSANAELDICRILTLRQTETRENIVEQGAVGTAFFVILEGVLERGTLEEGKQDNMLAGEIFGQESLISEEHINEAWVSSRQPTSLLEVRKEYFDRYVRPMQLAEWQRVAALVSELPIFNEPDEVWEGNRLKRLLDAMHLKSYQAGSLILREGDSNGLLYFILSGHCHITKVVEEQRKKKATLPSPLRSNASIAIASASSGWSGGRAVDIVMLYRGSILDAEGPLELKPAAYTATAISHVEVACIDVNQWIHVDQPAIDEDTQQTLKKLGRHLPDSRDLQAKFRMDSTWGFFKNHYVCHLIYRRRKEAISRAGPCAAQRGNVNRDDLIPEVPLDNPPHFRWDKV